MFVLRYSRYSARMRMRARKRTAIDEPPIHSNSTKTDKTAHMLQLTNTKQTKTDIPQHTQPIYSNLPQLKNGKYDPRLLQKYPKINRISQTQ